jgi:hypothetical protein
MSLLYTGSTEQIIPTPKELKMAELQFLLADRADIDAYRTQPFEHFWVSGFLKIFSKIFPFMFHPIVAPHNLQGP